MTKINIKNYILRFTVYFIIIEIQNIIDNISD